MHFNNPLQQPPRTLPTAWGTPHRALLCNASITFYPQPGTPMVLAGTIQAGAPPCPIHVRQSIAGACSPQCDSACTRSPPHPIPSTHTFVCLPFAESLGHPLISLSRVMLPSHLRLRLTACPLHRQPGPRARPQGCPGWRQARGWATAAFRARLHGAGAGARGVGAGCGRRVVGRGCRVHARLPYCYDELKARFARGRTKCVRARSADPVTAVASVRNLGY